MSTRADLGNRLRGPSRLRMILVAVLLALLFLFVVLWNLAGIYTDALWFDSVEQRSVFDRILRTRILLGAIFTTIFFVMMWINLTLAERFAPQFLPIGPEDEMLRRYNEVVGRRSGSVRFVLSMVLALIAGLGVSGRWKEWLLFTNSTDVGVNDPLFDTDVGFYLFRLPFLSFVVDWLFASLLIVAVVTAVAHYFNGGIRVQQPMQRVTPQVKAHLSVILGLLALVRAADYWLQRYDLTVSTRGTVDGALYADVRAKLPAINLLLLIAVLAAGLFLFNIRRRGWALPVVAMGLWAFVAIAAGTIYPTVVQWYVAPSESEREAQFLDRNIAATRDAFALNSIEEVEDFRSTVGERANKLTEAEREDGSEIFENLMLLDPVQITANLEENESKFSQYTFGDSLDVDRYVIDGEISPVIVGVRELNLSNLPNAGWEGSHLTFTHGCGAVVARATETEADGDPKRLMSGVPVNKDDAFPESLEQSRVYFGEGLSGYAIVNSERAEDDRCSGEGVPYSGVGGVKLDSIIRRTAFAFRFSDYNPIISTLVGEQSEILYVRDVRDRVAKVAPFLSFDADPYAVILNNRVKYVIDGYTTSARYPYSQRAQVDDVDSDSGLNKRFNYVRNSVKAVVDGYDGTVTLYAVTAEQDPIIEVWRRAFPELFVPMADMPADLAAHIRYPSDLFRTQSNMWGRYRLDQAQEFYDRGLAWVAAQDPGSSQAGAEQVTVRNENAPLEEAFSKSKRIDPTYQMFALPGEEKPEFSVVRSYVRQATSSEEREDPKQLTAMLVGRTGVNPDDYNRLQLLETPDLPDGPALIQANFLDNDVIARELSLLDESGNGSEVRFGDMQILPVGNSLVYTRPVYVQSESDITQVPQLRFVLLSDGTDEVMSRDVETALTDLLGSSPVTPEPDPDEPDPDPDPGNPGSEPTNPGPTDGINDDIESVRAEIAQLQAALDALADALGNLDGVDGTSDETSPDTTSVPAVVDNTVVDDTEGDVAVDDSVSTDDDGDATESTATTSSG